LGNLHSIPPRFYGHRVFSWSDLTICQGEYVPLHHSDDEASPVSSVNLTPKAESKILKAFDGIHALGVLHCDIRADNILVGEEGNHVWIVDFEFAHVIGVGEDAKQRLSAELKEVKRLLTEIRNNQTH
jgi:serine/threonine protein kinase